MIKETIDEKVKRLNAESTKLEAYNPDYPEIFEREKDCLYKLAPDGLINRIEHFGSTAIPGIFSKPIVDLLVEVNSLDEVKEKLVPVLEGAGYDYLWRPTVGMQPPWYAWFIKRNNDGDRTHHIHMIEKDFKMWERLLFRDYLRDFPEEAMKYDTVKRKASEQYPSDRQAYTEAKTEIVFELTQRAIKHYKDDAS